MQKEIITSNDGSHTLRVAEMNETYHSIHGALNESRHVFIEMGIDSINGDDLNVFEVGFGTGLNAMTTLEWQKTNPGKSIHYHTIDPFPVEQEITNKLNYGNLFSFDNSSILFQELHQVKWDEVVTIVDGFELYKIKNTLQKMALKSDFYDCIYFDAFAPNKQPDMWSVDILEKCFKALKVGGRFVTYCAKGQLKRDLKQIGFDVRMVAGPPGKREMTTAVKAGVR